MWFEQIFQAPENSKPEDCRVGLEDGLFYVQIPKKATQKQQPAEKVHAAKTPRAEEDSDHGKGKKVNDSGGDTIEKISASTPTKAPKDEEGLDRDENKAKKVTDSDEFSMKNEGTIDKTPASTPTKAPRDDEGSDLGKAKKVNDSGEFPNKNEGTIDSIPAATPKDEDDSNQENQGKKEIDNGDIPNNSEEEQYHKAKGGDKPNESNFLAKVAKRVKQNKGIFITAILIFFAGVLVSQDKCKKANSNEELLVKLDSKNHNDDE